MLDTTNFARFVEQYRSKSFNAVDEATLHGIIGLVSEVGELADLAKKAMWREQGLYREALIDECGDCLHYIQMILGSVGATNEEATKVNIRKIAHRAENGKDKEAENIVMFGKPLADAGL